MMILLLLVLAGPPTKVSICHKEGNGSYHLIKVEDDSVPAHRAHGDGLPGERVPGMPWLIFGPGCELCQHP